VEQKCATERHARPDKGEFGRASCGLMDIDFSSV
jgi:hypothetical protein